MMAARGSRLVCALLPAISLAAVRPRIATAWPARAAHGLPRLPPPPAMHASRRRAVVEVEEAEEEELSAELSGSVLSAPTARRLSERRKKLVAYQQRYECAACGCMLPPSYQVDHVVPLALGGTNGLANLQALCLRCHTQKTRDQRHSLLDAARDRAEEAETAAEKTKRAEAATPPGGGTKVAGGGAVSNLETAIGSVSLDGALLSPLELLRGMNEQQLAAVVRLDGPVQVLAGPGTGKTRALTARMAYLVGMARVPARRVLALTFTNKAARELRSRMEALVGPERAEQITMGTYHSLCLAMLRQDIEALGPALPYRRGFAVYDEEDARKLTRDLLKKEGLLPSRSEASEDEMISPATVHARISAAKNAHLDAEAYAALPEATIDKEGRLVAKVRAPADAMRCRLCVPLMLFRAPRAGVQVVRGCDARAQRCGLRRHALARRRPPHHERARARQVLADVVARPRGRVSGHEHRPVRVPAPPHL